jgi:hypothetical protein
VLSAVETLEEGHIGVHTAVWYSKHKSQESACGMDLVAAVELRMDFAFHTIGNRSSYMAVGRSPLTRIRLDCLVLFPMEHNKLELEFHNSDNMQLLPGVVLRTHYTSLLSSLSVHTNLNILKLSFISSTSTSACAYYKRQPALCK